MLSHDREGTCRRADSGLYVLCWMIHASSHFATASDLNRNEHEHNQRQTWKTKLVNTRNLIHSPGIFIRQERISFCIQSHINAMASQLLPLGESLHSVLESTP